MKPTASRSSQLKRATELLTLSFLAALSGCAVPDVQLPVDAPQVVAKLPDAKPSTPLDGVRRLLLSCLVSESLQPGLLSALTEAQVACLRAEVRQIRQSLQELAAVSASQHTTMVQALAEELAVFERRCRADGTVEASGGYSAAYQYGVGVYRHVATIGKEMELWHSPGPELEAVLLRSGGASTVAGSRRLNTLWGLSDDESRPRRSPVAQAASAAAQPNAPVAVAKKTPRSERVLRLGKTILPAREVQVRVERGDNAIVGSLARIYVYVNGVEVGGVDDACTAEFTVPVSPDGRYEVSVAPLLGFKTASHGTRAAPGDLLRFSTNFGYMGVFLENLRAEPRVPLRVCVVGEGAKNMALEGDRIPNERTGLIEIPAGATAGQVVRLTVSDGKGQRPVFASVSQVPFVFRGPVPELADRAFLQQLELARAYYFRKDNSSFESKVTGFLGDLAQLLPEGCSEVTRELAKSEQEWASMMTAVSREGLWGDALLQLVEATAQVGIEALITRSVPTRADAFVAAGEAVLGTAWDGVSRKFRVGAIESRANGARAAAFSSLKEPRRPASAPWCDVLTDNDLACKLIGTWVCQKSPLTGKRYAYVFDPSGLLRQLDEDGEQDACGAYHVRDARVCIRWASGGEEVGKCEWRDAQLRYTVVSHSDRRQINDVSVFRRQKD